MRKIEKKRESRLITLIHRQAGPSLLSFLTSRYIDIEDSEEILRAIRSTAKQMPIDLIVHTPGGLASDEIVMDSNAVLGRADPQIFGVSAVSVKRVLEQKNISKIKDQTLILGDLSKKAVKQMEKFTHDYPLTFEDAKKLGLNVSDDVPGEVYRLMELYPQPRQCETGVQYIREPYKKNK